MTGHKNWKDIQGKAYRKVRHRIGNLRWQLGDDGDIVYIDDVGQVLTNIHKFAECEGPCPVHRPSKHHMADWPLVWRNDRGFFERICEHGVGHPDPDNLYRLAQLGHDDSDAIHGCDGCCNS
jgi:hypothetical protein